MTLTTNALTALQSPTQTAIGLLTLSLPSDAGGTMRLAQVDTSVIGDGHYDGRIVSGGWSPIKYSLSDREGNLQAVETSVTIDDTGTQTQPVGPFGRAIKLADCQGSVAVIKLAIAGLATTDYPTLFTGILDRWERQNETQWRLYLRVDDTPLRRPAVRVKIGPADWPAAKQESLGQYVPIVFGTTSSSGLGSAGMRTCPLVDTARFRYLVSLGTVSATGFSVYSNGVLKTSVTDYNRNVVIVGGRTYTVVDFVVDQVDAVITVDCQGINMGALLTSTNPVDQLRFVLEFLVYSDWNGHTPTVAELSALTHTDQVSFVALSSTFGSYEGSPILGGTTAAGATSVDGMTLLSQFCQSFSAVCWWTETGTIAIGFMTPFTTSIYPTDPVMFYGHHLIGSLGLMTSSDELVRAMTMRYLLGSDSQPSQSISVYHPNFITAPPKDRLVSWGPGRVI